MAYLHDQLLSAAWQMQSKVQDELTDLSGQTPARLRMLEVGYGILELGTAPDPRLQRVQVIDTRRR